MIFPKTGGPEPMKYAILGYDSSTQEEKLERYTGRVDWDYLCPHFLSGALYFVDPAVGLYASFIIAVTISFVGGRPAMISAATGAMALLMVTLVRDHGIEYLFAASLLTGVFQILVGVQV
jgi:hypothetical protein